MSITNNSKRKPRLPNSTNNRPNVKPNRVRPKGLTDRNIALEGVYSNARFMHSAASSVGCVVYVQVENGNVYEGVFSTFSQDLDLVLEMVNRVVDKDMSKVVDMGAGSNGILKTYNLDDYVAEKMIFKLSDIVSTFASCIDLDFATKDGFTDTAISKYSGPLPERELEPWEGPGEDLTANSLDGGVGEEDNKGWDANEMFEINAEKYKVKSTYDSSLQGYTIPLEPKNTDEYKKKEARASKIAQEIENNTTYKQRMNLENGDEEERFSAVLRPVMDNNMSCASTNRYVSLKKNTMSGGSERGGGGKLVKNSVPPYVHPNKNQSIGGGGGPNSITPTHSYHKMNSVPTPPNSLPILASPSLGIPTNSKPPLPHQGPPANVHYMNQAPSRAPNLNHNISPAHLDSHESDKSDLHNKHLKEPLIPKNNSGDYRFQEEISMGPVPPPHNDAMSSSPGQPLDKLRGMDDKKGTGRDEQIAEFKKFSSDFKLTDDHRPGGREDQRENAPPDERSPAPLVTNKDSKEDLADQNQSTPENEPTLKLSDSGKKYILNPNAKAFTPRAVPAATPPAATTMPLPRLHTQSPVVAMPQHQFVHNLGQPIFTPTGHQYVMSAGTPVSMSMSINPSFAPANMSQAHRFRKTGPMTVQQAQQEFSPSVQVAAATGQPILTSGMPNPSQLQLQYNPTQGMMAGPSPHQTAMAYTQMMYRYPAMVGPRVVSPQPFGDVFMSPHPGAGLHSLQHSGVSVSAVQSMVPPQGNPGGPHSNPQTPQGGPCTPMHTAPSPVHQQGGPQTPHGTPSQTPTPTGHPVTTQQSVVFSSQMAPPPLSMQGGGLHSVPTSQAMQLHPSHISQVHPHAHHHNFATTQQVVLMQQAVPTHGPHPGSLSSSGPHSLQGHTIHGQSHNNHMGNPPPHVISHAPMTVIPTSAAAMVHASIGGHPFAPHGHQGRDRGRQHTGNR